MTQVGSFFINFIGNGAEQKVTIVLHESTLPLCFRKRLTGLDKTEQTHC